MMLCALLSLLCSCSANHVPNNLCLMLETSSIANTIPMQDYLIKQGKIVEFDNEVLLLTLSSGIKAVFKPCPSGSNDLADFYAEVVAYRASQFMEFDIVPPTVMRTIDGRIGSLQLFVDTNQDPLTPGTFLYALEHANPDDVANLKIFYFVFGQWDTGPHNILILFDDNGTIKLLAIDNAGIRNRQYVRYGELPFVRIYYNEQLATDDYDKPFPFADTQLIQNPTAQELNICFRECIPHTICTRLARKKIVHYVLYQDSLWIQFHAGVSDFVKSFTMHYPEKTIKKLKQLTFDVLKNQIFADAYQLKLFSDEHLYAILERRDQILQHYDDQKK